MEAFDPFGNDSQSWSVGVGEGLTVQNGTDIVSIFGQASFGGDARGKALAGELLALLRAVSAKLPDGGEEGQGLRARRRGATLSVGGEVDLGQGAQGKAGLSKAMSALTAFVEG